MIDDIFEDYAHSNGLSGTDPGLRIILGTGTVVLNTLSQGLLLPVFIAVSMGVVTVGIARIPFRVYLRLLSIPVFFALTGVIVILFLNGGGKIIVEVPIGWYHLTISEGGVMLAVTVFIRTLAGMSALYLIALTVPVTELFTLVRKAGIPVEIVDLAMLMYRYIFILIGEAIALYDAQMMRNGYHGLRNSIDAFSMLASTLFIRAWEKGEALLVAMDARCYDGRFGVLETAGRPGVAGILSVCIFFGVCGLIIIVNPVLWG